MNRFDNPFYPHPYIPSNIQPRLPVSVMNFIWTRQWWSLLWVAVY